MAAKVFFDVANRFIELIEPPVNGVASIDLRVDVYSDGKEDWELNVNGERAHRFPFVTSQTAGGPTTGGRTEPIFFRQRNGVEGWRILPYDADHTLFVNGTLVPQDSSLPLVSPRAGRTILIITDGSEVAGLTQGNALSEIEQAQLALIDDVNSNVVSIKGKTDNLTFSKANEVDANIQSVNDVTVTGTGSEGDEWGP